jgi:hypothetical protein
MKKIVISIFTLSILVLGFSFTGSADSSDSNVIEEHKANSKQGQAQVGDNSFDKMMRVLTHQRCVNCHPAGNIPIKGDDKNVTRSLGVPRGIDGHGLMSINCETCHTNENNDFSGVPGAPDWALAPEIMAWEGKTRVEIATQMMDPKRNGGRTADEIMKHLTEHELVLWAWNPGVDAEGVPREKPPVPKDEYIEAVKEWIANGAVIPQK